MEPVRLWAAVEFTAQSGSTAALLRQQGLRVVGESGIAALLAEDVR